MLLNLIYPNTIMTKPVKQRIAIRILLFLLLLAIIAKDVYTGYSDLPPWGIYLNAALYLAILALIYRYSPQRNKKVAE